MFCTDYNSVLFSVAIPIFKTADAIRKSGHTYDAVLSFGIISLCVYAFPASRGLFSVVFAELTGARKRDLIN